MAVLAAVADQKRRLLQAGESGFKGRVTLRVPSRGMTTDALGVELPGNLQIDQGLGGVGVGRVLPDFMRLFVAFAATAGPGEAVPALVPGGPDLQARPAQVAKLALVA